MRADIANNGIRATVQPPLLVFSPDADHSDAVCVDLERLIVSRMLIQANSGGGKSWALRYLLEQTSGKIQQFIFDPEGEFATLREHFPYVLVGGDGDLAADPASAGALCERLMELEASAVFDLYDLRLSDRRRFVRVFLDQLMTLPRDRWHPVLVVIDEAHTFCPERGAGEAESTEAVITLCTQGRKRPFATILATQRIAKLHKDAAADLLNVLIGRTELDVDIARAAAKLGFSKERRNTLPHLEPGTFYAYGPAISREVRLVQTGVVRTTHPQPGALTPPAPPPPAAILEVLAQLQDLPVPPADVRAFHRPRPRIGDLEMQLPQVERIIEYVPVISDSHLAQLVDLAAQLEAAAQLAASAAANLRTTVASAATAPPPTPDATAGTPERTDWERVFVLPAVAAKITQAQASLPADASSYLLRVLAACAVTPLTPLEMVEAWGLRGHSTLGRVQKACAALQTVRLLVDDGGRLKINRGELERLAHLAATVGPAGAGRTGK